MTTPTPDELEQIVARYEEIAVSNGSLATVATADEYEILAELVDVALETVPRLTDADLDDLSDALRPGLAGFLAKLKLRFEPKTLVVRIPVVVDLERVSGNDAPEGQVVAAVLAAVAPIPFLEVDQDFHPGGLSAKLAVTLEARS